jgi:hypothetical protein
MSDINRRLSSLYRRSFDTDVPGPEYVALKDITRGGLISPTSSARNAEGGRSEL